MCTVVEETIAATVDEQVDIVEFAHPFLDTFKPSTAQCDDEISTL